MANKIKGTKIIKVIVPMHHKGVVHLKFCSPHMTKGPQKLLMTSTVLLSLSF
jgi:hypothetical protein